MISYEDFKKLELRVAKIKEANRVDGSEKLIRLTVDLGEEQRQIIAGVGKKYEPETLIGKEIVVIANLEYRKLMGLESQGMLLAASTEDGPVLLTPEEEVMPGASIQ